MPDSSHLNVDSCAIATSQAMLQCLPLDSPESVVYNRRTSFAAAISTAPMALFQKEIDRCHARPFTPALSHGEKEF
jgi:hypothetical protein